MKPAPLILSTALMFAAVAPATAAETILRLRPAADAPIVKRISATEKVLLEAAPVGENSDWMQLELKLPFQGYVPAATLSKNFAILDGTPVHTLPDANTDVITRAKNGDLYEILQVREDWATVQFNQELTTYFRPQPTEAPQPALEPVETPEPPVLDLSVSAPTHTPQPNAVRFDPDRAVAQTAPEDLPPENVVWNSVTGSASRGTAPAPTTQVPIMVGPDETQAREVTTSPTPEPGQPIRELRGTLVREIEAGGPAYPIRLRSPEGRLIAYVDFSGIFIDDLDPYLEQRVSIRGPLVPLQQNKRDLIIFTREIQLAD